MMLSNMQVESIEFKTGPADPAFNYYMHNATDPDKTWMCDEQIVRRDDYASSSILGLCIIFIIGGIIIILLNLASSLVWERWQARTSRGICRNLEWLHNGTLQLQRLALEDEGITSWSGTSRSNPIPFPADQVFLLALELENEINAVEYSLPPVASSPTSDSATDVKEGNDDHEKIADDRVLGTSSPSPASPTSPLSDAGTLFVISVDSKTQQDGVNEAKG